jgi:hypothetical protein
VPSYFSILKDRGLLIIGFPLTRQTSYHSGSPAYRYDQGFHRELTFPAQQRVELKGIMAIDQGESVSVGGMRHFDTVVSMRPISILTIFVKMWVETGIIGLIMVLFCCNKCSHWDTVSSSVGNAAPCRGLEVGPVLGVGAARCC